MIMNDTKKQVPVYLHLISGLITALGCWTLLKVFKVYIKRSRTIQARATKNGSENLGAGYTPICRI